MVLEYRTNRQTWNMIDGDISFCYDSVSDEVKEIKEKYTEDKWNIEISKMLRKKCENAGFLTTYPHYKNFTIITEKNWGDISQIMIVSVERKGSREIFVFDYFHKFRILYNDGTVIREFGD